MKDYLFSAVAADGFLRVIGAETTELVRKAQTVHNTTAVATAALGRVLTAAVLLSKGLKNPTDIMTIQFKGKGPLGGVIAVTTADAKVRGYVDNPDCLLPLTDKGKLDVGGAIGKGFLNIIKDLGLKEPYTGTIPLVSGEVAEDIACYLSVSEQIPSVVSLGVLAAPSRDGTVDFEVACAGGFILQLMPGAPESLIDELEKRVRLLCPVTELLSNGSSMRKILTDLLNGYDLSDVAERECGYVCTCSRERMEKTLFGLGRAELEDIIAEQGDAEIQCHFCNSKYTFSKAELQKMVDRMG